MTDRPWPTGHQRAFEGEVLITKTRKEGGIGFLSTHNGDDLLCKQIAARTEVVVTELPEHFCQAHQLTGTEHPALFRIDEGDGTHGCVRFFETGTDVPLNDFPEGVRFKVGKAAPCIGE